MTARDDTPHGGRLRAAAGASDIPLADWLDVSTGIAPWSWPVPPVPEAVWARLPEPDDGLIAAAAAYYDAAPTRIVAVPGSQFAIQALPTYRAPGRVGIPRVGYREHERAWRAAGHTAVYYDTPADLLAMIDTLDAAIVLAPNNPLADMPSTAQLAAMTAALPPGGLILDAAFLDCHRAPPRLPRGAIVLRSMGKFFGLAGLRLGFVIGAPAELTPLAQAAEPRGVSTPARWVGCQALRDQRWQQTQRARTERGADQLQHILRAALPTARIVSGGLFVTACFDDDHTAGHLHAALARQGILARLGDDRRWLRFGLVRETMQPRLADALRAAAAYPQGR